MRFEEAYEGRTEHRLTQADAARLPGCPRTACRTLNRYQADSLTGLLNERLAQVSHRRPPWMR